jgi:MFS family permease
VATAVGPALGGWLIGAGSWRWIFALNLPVALAVVVITLRYVPESRDEAEAGQRPDLAGAALGAASLTAVTYGFIRWGEQGGDGLVMASLTVGVLALAGFVLLERRLRHPMLPPGLFANRRFTGANLVTFGLYAALSAALFLLVVRLQNEVGYSPLAAGFATLPVTLLMLAGSDLAGRLAVRIGPRLPLTVGPVVAGVGLALFARIGPGSDYWTGVLPGVVVFGLGITLVVAPLTATVLASADDEVAGVASGVNNAVARTAGLLGVAVVPLLAGGASGGAFPVAMLISAGLAVASGVAGWVSLAGPHRIPEPRLPQYSCGAGAPQLASR